MGPSHMENGSPTAGLLSFEHSAGGEKGWGERREGGEEEREKRIGEEEGRRKERGRERREKK